MSSWKNLFTDTILSRGLDYYYDDRITNIRTKDGIILANVQGTYNYNVAIKIVNNQIKAISCNCPYSNEGFYCKHMAAVLYTLDDSQNKKIKEMSETITDNSEDELSRINKIMNLVDEKELKEFLLKEIENNEDLHRKFKLRFQKEISKDDLSFYQSILDTIFSECRQYDEHIITYDIRKLRFKLDNLIDNEIFNLINNKEYESVFDLTKTIYLKLLNIDKYDTHEGQDLEEIIEKCFDILTNLIKYNENTKLEYLIFEWITTTLTTYNTKYLAYPLKSLVLNYFNTPQYLALKNKFVEDNIAYYEQQDDNYELIEWIKIKMDIMNKLNNNQKEIEEFRNKYRQYPEIRKELIDENIRKNNINSAIVLLKESRQLDKDSYYLVEEYTVQLKNLYKQTGNIGQYKEELVNLVFKYAVGNMKYTKELKNACTKNEWLEIRKNILILYKNNNYYKSENNFYYEEKLYDNLIINILKGQSISELQKYEKTLKPLYPREILSLYTKTVKHIASYTGGRKHYQRIVSMLNNMITYPNGKEVVEQLLNEWNIKYKKRPVMLEELGKVNI